MNPTLPFFTGALLLALSAHAGGFGAAVQCTADLPEDAAVDGVMLRAGPVGVKCGSAPEAPRAPTGRWAPRDAGTTGHRGAYQQQMEVTSGFLATPATVEGWQVPRGTLLGRVGAREPWRVVELAAALLLDGCAFAPGAAPQVTGGRGLVDEPEHPEVTGTLVAPCRRQGVVLAPGRATFVARREGPAWHLGLPLEGRLAEAGPLTEAGKVRWPQGTWFRRNDWLTVGSAIEDSVEPQPDGQKKPEPLAGLAVAPPLEVTVGRFVLAAAQFDASTGVLKSSSPSAVFDARGRLRTVIFAQPTRVGTVTLLEARFNAAGRLTSGLTAGPDGRWFEGSP